ncbi:UDP-forming cellulose synthase catalytic subunit [Zavarzinia aquatilis]|uniref:Cellulose synthase catalytic subunit [UDP-forming] n=1 Tax=Zavarzinia aquatilis TaxID=2211142 RepID=A0A317E243_9PROT|nr:UDP-forming cellulose synthase catalytic subunit [Zavarzinia aquatilis]PWR21157.1 cellulose synthase catalytic subunit (UDP-forming) [Zavarzinia aquatilis]
MTAADRHDGQAPAAPARPIEERMPRWGFYAALLIGGCAAIPVVIAPFDLYQQIGFGVVVFIAGLIMNRWRGQNMTVMLSVLSVLVSTRYLYWRATETLTFENWFGALLGFGLFFAEFYAWLILVLGYFQTALPLERKVEILPDDLDLWPTVDVYIPTYNEALDIVSDTILAAANLDYPADKLRVHVLDDGRRQEFREFARKIGVNYIVRPDNAHAKAGNLNHAMKETDGELICIFDADHVPTRAFLQMTVGGFLTDPKLSLVQTPHHFYSPDPFERNIRGGDAIPNEGELFYGPVQKGNDLWNAAFFCGSCAVIRREALDSVGGFAVETVTEDAHTALRMQKLGWNTAYLDIALAAGRATERLVLHVGQRVRWARGMTQILRRENPLFGGKLTLAQRLCYLNAMLHFQFALPRIVFLTAPVAFLLLGQNIIASTAPLVLAYALPHLLHSNMTNMRVHSRYRLTFWGELYETSLSFHLVWPVLAAMINPKLGKFNVTEKGGLLEREYFDFRIARFHLLTLGIVTLGLIIGCYRLVHGWSDGELRGVLLMNVAWSLFSGLILIAAIAAARETRQIRKTVRLPIALPATIFTEEGHAVCVKTLNLSTGGALIRLPEGVDVDADLVDGLELPVGDGAEVFPVKGIAVERGLLRTSFEDMPVDLYRMLVGVVFGRADAWVVRRPPPSDKPSTALLSLMRATTGLFAPSHTKAPAGRAGQPRPPVVAEPPALPSRASLPGARVTGASVVVALVAALAFLVPSGRAAAQVASPSAGAPQVLPQPPALPSPPSTSALPVPSAPVAPGGVGAPPVADTAAPAMPLPPVPGVAATPGTGAAATPMAGSRTVKVSLKELGAIEPLRLLGVEAEIGFPLDIRRDEVVTAAKFVVTIAYSPSLLPELSHMTALVNGEVVGSMRLERQNAGGLTVEIPVNPALFVRYNRIGLRVIGHYTMDCENPVHSSLWSIISNQSALELTLQPLPQRSDLAALPAPFFDSAERKALSLPIALPAGPSSGTIHAATIVASYFAAEAGFRGSAFPVSLGSVPTGNAVVIATPEAQPPGLGLPPITGPTLSVVGNPSDAFGRLLVVAGRNDDELRAAATTLALGSVALSGTTMTVGVPSVPPRQPYDAPRWLRGDRPVRFGELVEPGALQGAGFVPGPLAVPFRTSPDLFVWSERGLPMTVRYRYPRGEWLDLERSRLDVAINREYLKSLPLGAPTILDDVRDIVSDDFVLNESRVKVPPFQIFGSNQLSFFYDLRPKKRGECEGTLPTGIRSGIDPDSTIDISGAERFAVMPNLSYFASAGFPFTRVADMGDTAAILPDRPKAQEIEALLDLMGRFGEFTGFPPLRLTVLQGSANLVAARGKDVLAVGTLDDRLGLPRLLGDGPIQLSDNRLNVASGRAIDRVYNLLDGEGWTEDTAKAGQLLLGNNDFAGILGRETGDGQSLVMVLASRSERLPKVVAGLADTEINAAVSGDLAIFDQAGASSFRIGPTYTVGHLGAFSSLRWYFRNNPILLSVMTVVAVVLLAVVIIIFLRLIARLRLRRPKAEV